MSVPYICVEEVSIVRKHSDKITACVLLASFALSSMSLSGCNLFKKQSADQSLEVIKDSTPWYDLEKHMVDTNYEDSEFDKVSQEYIGSIDGEAIFYVREYSELPEDVSGDQADPSLYSDAHLDFYSFSGEITKSFDLEEIFNPLIEKHGFCDVSQASMLVGVVGDKIMVEYYPMDENYNRGEVIDILDPATGEVTEGEVFYPDDPTKLVYGTDFFSFDDTEIDVSVLIGGYIDSPVECTVTVKNGGTTVGSSILGDVSSVDNYEKIKWMVKSSEDTILFAIEDPYGYQRGYFCIDLNTGAVSPCEEDITWLTDISNIDNVSYVSGVGNLVCDDYGIRLIDFEGKSADYIFRFDYCNINRFDVSSLKLVDYSEEQILFAGDVERSDGPVYNYYENDSYLYRLTKAETNPHAGKEVIRIASIGDISYAAAEAVCAYNAGDHSCFAVIDDRYLSSADPLDTDAYMTELADIENRLSVDLIAGDGPDILLNTLNLKQFNSPDLLVDLSSYIPEGNYFTNVFEAAKTDGVLYQMPLTCGMQGISTDRENAGSSVGMSYDEYTAFVSGICNGDDPVDMTQLDFFCLCVDNMSDLFTTGDSISFDNEAFRELAEYTNDNIFDPIVIEYSDPLERWDAELEAEFEEHPAELITIESFNHFAREYKFDDKDPVFLGLPSSDGRGPAISCNDSVAVSAKSDNVDGCIEFVNVLLSDEIQTRFADSGATPVNVDAFEISAARSIEIFNDTMAAMEARSYYNRVPIVYLDESDIQEYEDLIRSCDHMPATDNAVMLIVREEIQAYFAGQKSLDEVLDTITNRVDLFVSERG